MELGDKLWRQLGDLATLATLVTKTYMGSQILEALGRKLKELRNFLWRSIENVLEAGSSGLFANVLRKFKRRPGVNLRQTSLECVSCGYLQASGISFRAIWAISSSDFWVKLRDCPGVVESSVPVFLRPVPVFLILFQRSWFLCSTLLCLFTRLVSKFLYCFQQFWLILLVLHLLV